jgi:hypothetical protein
LKAFYFKDQKIEDNIRDIDSGVEEVDENGRTKKDDYLSIQLKVPMKECDIDFQNMPRWTTLVVLTRFDFEALQMGQVSGMSKIEVYNAMIAYNEDQRDELIEKRNEAISEITPMPEEE